MSGSLWSGSGPDASTTVRAGIALAARGRDGPGAFGLVEVESVDLDAELDAAAQVEIVDHVLDVLQISPAGE